MVTKILQKVILPINEKHQAAWQLFYHGPRFTRDLDKDSLVIGTGNVADFVTYINGFSCQKWRLYTNVKNITLHLSIIGECQINMVGYHLEPTNPIRHEFAKIHRKSDDESEIIYSFPDENVEQMYGFEIEAIQPITFISGYYTGDYEEKDVHNVNLALCTTTCRKEKFIIANVQSIKGLIAQESDMQGHFEMHVVDNGRTLHREEINGDHVTLHPNKNTGGSGGFARGMIEAMHQVPKATHVLLMDDDVIILPESIRRTYELLTVLRPEYEDAFISGAMLDYEAMWLQIEDIGKVNEKYIRCESVKGVMNQSNLMNVLRTNEPIPPVHRKYAAWWYCCIPMHVIENNGLPLPIFIRQDDVEYGLRCKPEIITMTGICVWHMGFGNKYSSSMLMYQEFRNKLIGNAITGAFEGLDIYDRWKKMFRTQMLSFSYDGAELLLKAMEHYLEGPSFIEQDRGEQLLKENAALNDKMKLLSAFPKFEVELGRVYDQEPRNIWQRLIYRLTFNGHRFWPEKWLNPNTEYIGYDGAYQPQRWTLHKDVLLVNVLNRTAVLHSMDKTRWKLLMNRYKRDVKLYKQMHSEVDRRYCDQKEYIISEEFWKKYLNI